MANFEDFEAFLERLREIEAMGWVETHRNADTGIGKPSKTSSESRKTTFRGRTLQE